MISNRDLAIANGEKYYRTGKLCKNGHDDLRYTISSVCVQCNRQRAKNATLRIRKVAIHKGYGLKTEVLAFHPEDEQLVKSFIKACLLDRGIVVD